MNSDLPSGFTEEMISDIMKHTKKDRKTVIQELKMSRNNPCSKDIEMEKLNDPNYLLKIIPNIIGDLNHVLNPVKFKVTISNLDPQKLADIASLGEKWSKLDNEHRKR